MLRKLSRYAERGLHVFVLLTMLTYTAGFGLFFNVPTARAAEAANLDQCRNGSAASPNDCLDLGGSAGWFNGNAGSSNSHYVEGESIPYRAILTDLPTGVPIVLTIEYDTKHSGKHAIDYITHYDRIDANVDPTDGVTGASGSATDTFTIPAPGSVGTPMVGQPTDSFNALSAGEKLLSAWNADITAMSYNTQASINTASASTSIDVTFTPSSSTVVLAWGGHIGSRLDWGFDGGVPRSAGGISGSPYHSRLLAWYRTDLPINDKDQLPNLGNTDKSLSAGAVAPPANIIIEKQTIPDGSQQAFSFNSQTTELNGSLSDGQQIVTSLSANTYTVTEQAVNGWTLTNISCSDNDSTGDTATGILTLNVASAESVTCVFTNTRDTGDLKVVKLNQAQQPMAGVDFTIDGQSYSTDVNGEILVSNLETGDYTAEEEVPNNYTLTSVSGTNCTNANPSTATVVTDQTTTCTFTNTRDTGTIKVNKEVDTNGDGTFDGGNTEAASLGFVWGIDAESPARAMGSSETVVTGNYDISEHSDSNYHPSGWYTNGSNYSCENPESATLPASINVAKDGITEITLCNTRNTGLITFEKIVNGDALVSAWTFSIDGVLGSWMSGDSVTLPTGNYTVFESGPDGYTNTDVSGVCSPSTPGEGLLTVDTNGGTCTFTNTRDLGRLLVKKNVLNPDGSEVTDTHGFTVTLNGVDPKTLAEGTSAQYPGLATGTYTVAENPDGDYTLDGYDIDTDVNTPGAQITIIKGQTTVLTVTNKQIKATITISKDVRDFQGNDVIEAGNFSVTSNAGNFTIAEYDPEVLSVNPGTYTFTEGDSTNYTIHSTNPKEIIVGSNGSSEYTFVNWQKPSSITVCKYVDVNGDGSVKGDPLYTAEGGWTMWLDEEVNQQTVDGCTTFSNLKSGTYDISEGKKDGWTKTTPDTNFVSVTVGVNDHSQTVKFGNFQLGKIWGYKYDTLQNPLNGWKICLDGENCVTTGDGAWPTGFYEFTGLTAGTYMVSETLQYGWIQELPNDPNYHTVVVTSGTGYGEYQQYDFWNRKNVFDVSIDKTVDLSVVQAGANLTYTLNWSVTGNTPVEVKLFDALPTNTSFVSADNGGVLDGSTVRWNLGTFDPAANGAVHLTVKVNSPLDKGTVISNTGNICGLGAISEGEPFLSDSQDLRRQKCNNDTTTTTVDSEPLLGIAKVNNQEVAQGGDGLLATTETISYRVDWNVAGNSSATDVVLTDKIPTELNLNVASISNSGVWNAATRTITWNFGTQAPGSHGFVTYQATVFVPIADGTQIVNVARLSAANTDPTFVQDQSAVEVNVPVVLGEEALPALSIEKTVSVAFANPGDIVTYTIVVTNTGDAVAEGVTVVDTLPDGLHYLDTMAMDHAWVVGDLAEGESKTITYQVKVNASAIEGNYINTAVAWAAGVNNVTDTAILEVRKPVVLGAEDLPVTGAGFLTLAFSTLAGFGALVLSNRKRK